MIDVDHQSPVANVDIVLLDSSTEVQQSHRDTNSGSARIAFVFQSGGSLAAPQIGMLRALTEGGVVLDLVVGTSSGALNAVAFAASPSFVGLQRLTALWLTIRRRAVAPLSWGTVVGSFTGGSNGLVPARGMLSLLSSDVLPIELSDTQIPAHVVATDLTTGAHEVLSSGAAKPALLASAAYPGLYPPVLINGRLLVDGGISADTPVLQAEALGADIIYVLPAALANPDEPARHNPLAVAMRAIGQLLDSTARRDAASARLPVHILPAPISSAPNPLDFSGTAQLVRCAYEMVSNWLEDLARAVADVGATVPQLPDTSPASPSRHTPSRSAPPLTVAATSSFDAGAIFARHAFARRNHPISAIRQGAKALITVMINIADGGDGARRSLPV